MKKSLLLVSLALIFCACSKPTEPTTIQKPNEEFAKLLEAYYEEGLVLYPMNATFAGDNRFNGSFPNSLSDEFQDAEKTYYSTYLSKISEFKDEELTDSELMSKEIVRWECEINLNGLNFRTDLMPIDQMFSVNLSIGQFASGASAQPFKTVEDYTNWLLRLDGYIEWLKTAKSKMQEGIHLGYVLPKSLIVKVIPQMEALSVTDLDNHLFYSPIKNFPENFSDEEKTELTKAYRIMLTDKLIPAYQDLTVFLKKDYLFAGRSTSGIEGIPNGRDYYTHQIKRYTTTSMTAEEIHQLGLNEVSRILSEMEVVKNQVGYTGDLKSFFNFVRNKEELMPFAEPQQVIDHFYEIYDRMKPQVDLLFDKKPKTPFEVRRTETFRERSASAEYNQGSLDGTRPGIFYVPIPEVTKYNVSSDESLFLHEAIPGHHYQISLAMENADLPQFRKVLWYSGYGEGWALYTESLGKELGLFTDPYQYFGMLSAEMHRAIRLVVDTGLHSKGWTREQAIQYSLENEARSEAGITAEIERYMANPGQALSYKIGQLKIRELRKRAEEKLGDKFLIGQFHNQILESGCLPLALLETKINRWIDSF